MYVIITMILMSTVLTLLLQSNFKSIMDGLLVVRYIINMAEPGIQ